MGIASQEAEVVSNWENFIKSGKYLDGETIQLMFTNMIGHGAIELRLKDVLTSSQKALFHLGNNWPNENICNNETIVTNCKARIKSNIIGFKTAVKSIQNVNIATSQICSNAPFTSSNIIEEIKTAGTGSYQTWSEKIFNHPITKRGWGAAVGIAAIVAGIAGFSISGSLSGAMNNDNLKKIQSEIEVIDDLVDDVSRELIEMNEKQFKALDAEA